MGRDRSVSIEGLAGLMRGFAHDFNNRLHILSLTTELLGDNQELSAADRQMLTDLDRAVDQLQTLVEHLRLAGRAVTLPAAVADLATVVADAACRASLRGLDFDVEEANQELAVRGDGAALAGALLTLIMASEAPRTLHCGAEEAELTIWWEAPGSLAPVQARLGRQAGLPADLALATAQIVLAACGGGLAVEEAEPGGLRWTVRLAPAEP
jgi:hypothetical protein